MGTLLGELRYALRQFRVARVFTATAVLTLALGLGGTTAIFSLMHAVMLRSLPVGDPSRLYRIGDGDTCCAQLWDPVALGVAAASLAAAFCAALVPAVRAASISPMHALRAE